MDKLFLRMEHIPQQIFNELNFESLMNARLVAQSWKLFIDKRAHQWYSFKKKMAELEKDCKYGKTPFHMVCQNGQDDMVEIIMKNSAKLDIDLNGKDNTGMTAFHYACRNGHAKIAEMLVKNSAEFNIDLNGISNHPSCYSETLVSLGLNA